MPKNKIMPKTVSSRDIQTSYKAIFEEAMSFHEPIVVMKNNQPQVAIVSIDYLDAINSKIALYEEQEALDTLKSYENDIKNGTLVHLNSLEDLIDDED